MLTGKLILAQQALAAEPLVVEAINASVPTLCAESDNVYVKLRSPQVRHFSVEAAHPAYMGTIAVDRWAPDFWRPDRVPVRVGNRVETGFHLLQLWTRHQERAEEVLVLYPADGNWRARALPPVNLRWSAYGSSFMVGPIQGEARPFVDISAVDFDPATLTFTLHFKRGGQARLRLVKLDNERIVLDVDLDRSDAAAEPFLALRSMFVTEENSDVAWIGWLDGNRKAWQRAPVMGFGSAGVSEFWAGRTVPSRHNTSAPDMLFSGFSAGRQ